MKALLPRLLATFTALFWVSVAAPLAAVNPTRLMVDLSASPDPVMLSAFNLCVVNIDAKVDLEAQQTLGNTMLARINLFEVTETSPMAAIATAIGVPVFNEGKTGWRRLDATHPNWVPLVVREIVQHAAERGFDGFVLTGLETISQDAERAACLQAIQQLDQIYPDKQLILENGLDLVAEARRSLDGVLFLGSPENAATRDQRIREVKRHGLQSLVVDYLPEETPQAEIVSRTQRFRSMGAVPFFTTPELHGVHLGPLKEITRRVVILHSGPAQETFTARVLHGSLEWLGWQVIYRDLAEAFQTDPRSLPGLDALILDANLRPLSEHQSFLLNIVKQLQGQQIPLLLTGTPWGNKEDFLKWSQVLGLRGTGQALPAASQARLKPIAATWLNEQGAIHPRTAGFRDLQAPREAQVICGIEAAGTDFDQVFLASWGGLWLDELAPRIGPQIAPLKFLETWLGCLPQAPIMDMVSQNGRRLFIPVVQSEGFTQTTSFPGFPIAAEVLTERLLSRYSLPFTVAICEGDVRGSNAGLETRDSLRYEAAARSLFALPHVHAASSSQSRPANWEACTEMEREIAGSMAYIHRHLLAPGRSIELMLWPQGAWPSEAAVAFSHRMGVENALLPHRDLLPGRLPSIEPQAWGRKKTHLTILGTATDDSALRSNDFIAQAEAGNSTRWMQPVRAVLSFDDAVREESLWEAERILDWCAKQPLHAISLHDHARLIRDAVGTHVFEHGPGHWILVNAGHARTLRLPATAGVPDLDRSIGLAGYSIRGPDLYIHTLGRRRTEVVLTPQGTPDHLRLISASGKVRYDEAGQQRALLQVTDLRPVELSFAGIRPGAVCQIFTSEQPQFVTADSHGQVAVTVPAQTAVRLQVLNSTQAAMR